LTELQSKFIRAVEDYYRDKYPPTMQAKVADALPSSDEGLKALYNVLIRTVSAKYRTVPDLIAIQRAMNEVAEAYPELSAPPVPLLSEAPRGTSAREWFRLWAESISQGIRPNDYEPMQEFLRRQGVEPE
jgi:hypothetical protein